MNKYLLVLVTCLSASLQAMEIAQEKEKQSLIIRNETDQKIEVMYQVEGEPTIDAVLAGKEARTLPLPRPAERLSLLKVKPYGKVMEFFSKEKIGLPLDNVAERILPLLRQNPKANIEVEISSGTIDDVRVVREPGAHNSDALSHIPPSYKAQDVFKAAQEKLRSSTYQVEPRYILGLKIDASPSQVEAAYKLLKTQWEEVAQVAITERDKAFAAKILLILKNAFDEYALKFRNEELLRNDDY